MTRAEYISHRGNDYELLWLAFVDQKKIDMPFSEFFTSFQAWQMRRAMEAKPFDLPYMLFVIRKYYDIKFNVNVWI